MAGLRPFVFRIFSILTRGLSRAQQWLRPHPRASWVQLGLLYLLATVVVTYPTSLHLATRLAGDNSTSSDTLESVWGIWWWKHALLDLHQSPLEITLLNHPNGESFPLYPLMSQTFLLALPAAAATTPVLAYNLVFLLAFVLSGLCGYALCLEVTEDRVASFVGGLIWAFFPAKMADAVAGHLFLLVLFVLPVAALCLLRTLKSPSLRNGLCTALALALAATIHPTYLAYVVAPLVLVLIGHAAWTEGRAFWQRKRLLTLALALGLAAGLVALLMIPLFRQMLTDPGATWRAPTEVVGFSPDLLAYFIPSVDNPLIRNTPLVSLALRTQPYQYVHLVYLGWLPLGLALLGAGGARKKSTPWFWLALGGAILALGPLLKIGGQDARVTIAGESYRIVMPYAGLMNLPFVQWSRTPGRLLVLVILAMSVLATLGLSRLLKLPFARRLAVLAVGLCSIFILLEYQVRFPFPTFSAAVPTPVKTLRAASADLAVLQVPVASYQDNQRALYWQTVHQQPLVGGRVYRDLAEANETQAFYSSWLLSPRPAPGQALPSQAQRLDALAAARLGWVLYDAKAGASDSNLRAQLEGLLGPPVSEDSQAALFRLAAPPAPDALLWGGGNGWEALAAPGAPQRFCQRGSVYLFTPAPRAGQLHFAVQPGAGVSKISVHLNGKSLGRFIAGEAAAFSTGVVTLAQGFNRLEFSDAGDLTSPLAAAPAPCQVDGQAGHWGPAISALQFEDAAPASGVTFGDSLELVDSAFPAQTKPGQTATVHVSWRVAALPGDNLTVFVHLVSPQGGLAAQSDALLLGDFYPAAQWAVGDVVAYPITLTVPANAPAGVYAWQIGVYHSASQERLAVTEAEAKDNILTVGAMTVAP